MNYYQDDWDELLLMLNFAAIMLPSESTGYSPFFIKWGYELRTSFNWTVASIPLNLRVERGAAQILVKQMKEVWNLA